MENRDTVEIDFLMVVKKLLLQWRAVFIVSLVCGLLVMNIQYVRTKSASQAVKDVVEESLTEEEITAVNDAILLNQKISNLEMYKNNNPYMLINALDYKQLSMTVSIHAEAGVDARDIALLYVSNICSDEFIEKIIDAIDENVSVSDFTELLSAGSVKTNAYTDTSVENSDLVKVNILIPDNWNQVKLQEAVQAATEEIEIENYSGSYTRTVDYSAIEDKCNLDIQEKQSSIYSSLETKKTQLQTEIDSFTENQKELYNELLSGKTIDSVDNSMKMVAPKMSLKYFVLGFFIGLLGYVFIYVLIAYFDKKYHVEISDNMKPLAVIKLSEKAGIKRFLFEDRFLKSFILKRELNLKYQLKSFAQKLRIILKEQDDKKVYILSSKKCVTKLQSNVMEILNFVNADFFEIESSDDVDSFVNMIKYDEAYVVVTEDGVTDKSIISNLRSIAIMSEAQFLGQIIIL